MKEKHKVFLARLGDNYAEVMGEGMEWTGLRSLVDSSTRVCIKPNLTFPTFRKGVMTNPEAVEGIIRYLKDFTNHITICESDSGGYNRFSMDEVFRNTGLTDLAREYDVRVVNMSNEPARSILVLHKGRKLSVPLPRFLFDETDLFITMPVPKIHMNTYVSLSVKNQWGVIQNPPDRLKLHPYFWKVIYEVNKALPRIISVVDGKYGLTRSGPMRGDEVELNWLMISDNIFAADYICCLLMGISPESVPYLRRIFREEEIFGLRDVVLNTDYSQFVSQHPFYLKRAWTDYPGLVAFNSRLVAYLGYHSPLAGLLHKLLYLYREPFYDYDRYRKTNS